LDIEGGDRPAFGDYGDDDGKGKGGTMGGGVMGALAGVGGLGMPMAASAGAGADGKFFLDLRDKLVVAGGVGFLLLWLLSGFYMGFVFLVCMGSLAYAADLTAYIMDCDAGSAEMTVIADAIREGAEGYWRPAPSSRARARVRAEGASAGPAPLIGHRTLHAHDSLVSCAPSAPRSRLPSPRAVFCKPSTARSGAGVASLPPCSSLCTWCARWATTSTSRGSPSPSSRPWALCWAPSARR